MILFMTHNKYRGPVNTLCERLFNEHGIPVMIEIDNDTRLIGDLSEETPPTILVRYGHSGKKNMDERVPCVLNTAESINRASHKYSSLVEMQREGIPVVPFALVHEYLESKEIRDGLGVPVVGRIFHHFGGRDLRIINNIRNLPFNRKNPSFYSDYVMRFVPNTREYRVWTFNTEKHYKHRGKTVVLKTAEKIDGGTIDRGSQVARKRVVKNHKNGYIYQFPENLDDIPEAVRELAKKATETFDLDFAAVDIMHDQDSDSLYVLEVNTAPGCASESTITKLNDRFAKTYNKYLRKV